MFKITKEETGPKWIAIKDAVVGQHYITEDGNFVILPASPGAIHKIHSYILGMKESLPESVVVMFLCNGDMSSLHSSTRVSPINIKATYKHS